MKILKPKLSKELQINYSFEKALQEAVEEGADELSQLCFADEMLDDLLVEKLEFSDCYFLIVACWTRKLIKGFLWT